MRLEGSLPRSQESAYEPHKGQMKPRSPEPASLTIRDGRHAKHRQNGDFSYYITQQVNFSS
jgi:hypothetical protein